MPAYGSVTVYAYTSIARIPVEGAEVTVTAEDGSIILYRALTDRSGYIRTLTLETPEKAQSTAPSEQTAFTLVTITVRRAGYGTRRIRGVQVFPGTETMQGFPLIPVPPEQEDDIRQTDTPQQDL